MTHGLRTRNRRRHRSCRSSSCPRSSPPGCTSTAALPAGSLPSSSASLLPGPATRTSGCRLQRGAPVIVTGIAMNRIRHFSLRCTNPPERERAEKGGRFVDKRGNMTLFCRRQLCLEAYIICDATKRRGLRPLHTGCISFVQIIRMKKRKTRLFGRLTGFEHFHTECE